MLCNCMYVCYIDYCSNCSEIIIDGIRKDNNETLCKHISDDLIIEAKFPKVFKVTTFVVWFNCSNFNRPESCVNDLMTLTCNCSNLTAEHNGKYTIHTTLETPDIISLEWISNSVTVIVRSKT